MIVRMDGIVVKVRDNGRIINKTVYLCVGLKQNGLKEVLGMWVGKSESSSFRIGVLTDLKARGVQDILITYADNLNGFTDTIRTVFPSYSLKSVWYIRSETLVNMSFIRTSIIRKSKFPQNPKRSVRFSGKRTKRSVQKRKARNTQKAETKVL